MCSRIPYRTGLLEGLLKGWGMRSRRGASTRRMQVEKPVKQKGWVGRFRRIAESRLSGSSVHGYLKAQAAGSFCLLRLVSQTVSTP